MTDRRPIIVFGAGTVARIIRSVLDRESAYRVVALTVDRSHIDAGVESDLPVVPFEDVAARFPPSGFGMYVAVGYSRMNAVRAARCTEARAMGYELVSHVSPRTSTWSDFDVRPNTIIMEDCTIGPGAQVGEDCIVWPRCYIGHDARIGDHCYLAANSSVSGFTTVGARCVIGSAAVIRDNVTVGESCVVGVGAVLATNLEADSVIAAPLPRRLPCRGEHLPRL